jgi:hypothetical protein
MWDRDASRVGWSELGDGPAPKAGARIDLSIAEDRRYERRALIGRGGMGEVALSWDQRLRREVAVKRVPADAPAGAADALIEEARITAHLQHPGIVGVHDIGVDEGGPWVAFSLVRGRTLADAADRPLVTRVRHLLAVCEAVAFAHRVGVVHRDLKPSNVLIGDLGETQVADWGLAAALPGFGWDGVLGDASVRRGAGTPGFVAPEQAAGADPHPTADVYSLGRMLHLVADPAPPAELTAVADRATAEDPGERYASAAELAADVAAWLDGQPVSAYQYHAREVALRFVRRWRAPLAVGGIASVILFFGLGASWFQTRAERDRATRAEAQATAALAEADRQLGTTLLAQARTRWAEGGVAEAEVLAAHARARHDSPAARGVIAGLAAEPRPTRVRREALPCRVEATRGDGVLCRDGQEVRFVPTNGPGWRVDVGAEVGAAGFAGDAVLVSVRDGALWRLERRSLASGAVEATMSPIYAPGWLSGRGDVAQWTHGQFTAWFYGTSQGRADVCDGVRSTNAAFVDPHHRELVYVCTDGTVERFGVDGRPSRTVRTGLGGRLHGAQSAVALAGRELLVGTAKGTIVRVGAEGTERWVAAPLVGPILSLCLADREDRVMAVADRGAPALLDVATGRILARLPATPRGCAFVGDDQVATVGKHMDLWSLQLGPPARMTAGAGLTWVGVQQGEVVATAGDGGVVRFSADGALSRQQWQPRVIKHGAIAGERLYVASLGDPGIVQLGPGEQRTTLSALDRRPYRRLGALASGHVWGSSYGHGLQIWSGAGWTYLHPERVFSEGWTRPDGAASLLIDEEAQLWRLDDGSPPTLTMIPGGSEAVMAVAMIEDDPILAERRRVVRRSGDTELWTSNLDSPPVDATASADGRWVAVGLMDGTTRLLAADSGTELARFEGHQERVGAVAFTSDDQTLLSAGWDGVIRRWSVTAAVQPPSAEEVEAAWGIALADVVDAR